MSSVHLQSLESLKDNNLFSYSPYFETFAIHLSTDYVVYVGRMKHGFVAKGQFWSDSHLSMCTFVDGLLCVIYPR